MIEAHQPKPKPDYEPPEPYIPPPRTPAPDYHPVPDYRPILPEGDPGPDVLPGIEPTHPWPR